MTRGGRLSVEQPVADAAAHRRRHLGLDAPQQPLHPAARPLPLAIVLRHPVEHTVEKVGQERRAQVHPGPVGAGAHDPDRFAGAEPEPVTHLLPHQFDRGDPLEGESALLQPVLEVVAVESHVVALAEAHRPFLLVGIRVLVGDRAEADRHLKQAETVRREHPRDLPHRLTVVAHVLQHVVAHHQIRRTVRDRERGQVAEDVDESVVESQVDAQVPAWLQRTQHPGGDRVRRDVEEQIDVAEGRPERVHQDGQEPVPLQALAAWTASTRTTARAWPERATPCVVTDGAVALGVLGERRHAGSFRELEPSRRLAFWCDVARRAGGGSGPGARVLPGQEDGARVRLEAQAAVDTRVCNEPFDAAR